MDLKYTSQEEIKRCLSELRERQPAVFLTCTGAGAKVIDIAWWEPGASAFLKKFEFPYDQCFFNEFLNFDWKAVTGYGYCDLEGAIALSREGFYRSLKVGFQPDKIVSIGLSAAVATGRELRSGTRCFVAVCTLQGIHTIEVWLEQGFLGREGDGEICSLLAFNMMLFGSGISQIPLPSDLHLTSENLEAKNDGLILNPVLWSELVSFDFPEDTAYVIMPNGKVKNVRELDFSNSVIIPGSYSILHNGHRGMAENLKKYLGKEVYFEISIGNMRKNPITYAKLLRRIHQFAWYMPVIVSKKAKFVDKAKLYKGACFAGGFDTFIDVFNPLFYGKNRKKMISVLSEMFRNGNHFYAFTRSGKNPLKALWKIPFKFRKMVKCIPGQWNASSSNIKASLTFYEKE